MKIVKASIVDIYKVHKTLDEWHQDIGFGKLGIKDYEKLTSKLLDETRQYLLLVHGKKVVGMVWGARDGDEMTVEGLFLRRGFRGKMKFSRKLVEASLQMTEGFGTIRAVLPPGKLPRKNQRVLGTIVTRG